jgi:protein-tyrosine phosphatase
MHARGGESVPADIRELARRVNIDLAAHTARALDARLIESADLILGAAREHRSSVIRMLPRASRKTFTVGEFTRLAELLASSAVTAGSDLARLSLAEIVERIAARRGYVEPVNDDIVDPMGQTRSIQAASLAQMVSLSSRLGMALSAIPPTS